MVMDSDPTCIHGITGPCGRCFVRSSDNLQRRRAELAPVEPFRQLPTTRPTDNTALASDLRARALRLGKIAADLLNEAADLDAAARRLESK